MPLNKEVIGKTYESDPFEITEDQSIFYALGYNEDNDAYFDRRREGGILTPPMYAVKYGAGPTASIIFDEMTGMDFNFVVHYTQEYEWLKPVRPGDFIKSVGKITHVDVRKKGGVLGWTIVSKNQRDEEVVIAKWEFFDRSAGSDDAPDKKFEKVVPGEILFTQQMKVRNGQTYIYAHPSGDHNPIHMDNEFATGVGLPGIILQGLCTMAFTHKVAVDNLGGPEREPLKIKKLRVQMAKPVLPGQTLTFQGFKIGAVEGGTKYGFIVKNDNGDEVLRDTWCVVA